MELDLKLASRIAFLSMAVLILAVCSSGGSGGTGGNPIEPQNRAPTANAGADQNVAVGATVTLRGSGADPDGDPVSFSWSFVSTPAGSAAAMTSPNSATATFVPDLAGTYVLRLTVSDGRGATATGETRVVAALTNRAPTANAGSDQNVSVGESVTLRGSGTDPDGDPLTFTWSLSSKPHASGMTIANASSAEASFVADASGVYILQLTISDGRASGSASVRILAFAPGNVLTIDIIDFAFVPTNVNIPVGTTVRWTNYGAIAHDTASPGNWASPLLIQGQSFDRRFDQVGAFNYICTPHQAGRSGPG